MINSNVFVFNLFPFTRSRQLRKVPLLKGDLGGRLQGTGFFKAGNVGSMSSNEPKT